MAKIKCIKLKKTLEAMEVAPYPGDLGKKILENVSKQAWQDWLSHQTLLINERGLSMIDPKSIKYLEDQMHKFFFDDDNLDKISGYKPQ